MRIAPPLTITEEEIVTACQIILQCIPLTITEEEIVTACQIILQCID